MKKILFVVALFLVGFTISKQATDPTVLETILGKIERHTEELPHEKVYLQTDKPYYIAGETLWFKGYVVEAASHQLDSISHILYVDVLQEGADTPVSTAEFKIENGGANGYIDLPITLNQGNYQVRAYTNWMRNYSESLFFTKHFQVLKNNKPVSESIDNQGVSDLAILPEGGNLVQGVESIVAFKATNQQGKGVQVEGHIIANGKDTIAPFYAQYLGMGTFVLKPELGKTYSAVVKQAKGESKVFNTFPKVQPQGYVMSVGNFRKDNIRVKISHNVTGFKDGEQLFIVAQLRGRVMASAVVDAKTPSSVVAIPKEKIMGDGVVQITLFDNKGVPQCERLAYIEQGKRLQMSIQTDKTDYAPREKITMSVSVKDAQGAPVQGNFSMAVTNKDAVTQNPNAENLLSYMLLSSDVNNQEGVKGTIENPAYYFDKNNRSAVQHLDLLMMTQGWRRFDWKEVLAEKYPAPAYFIEPGFALAGTVLRPNGRAYENAKVTILAANNTEGEQLFMGQSDNKGQFNFLGIDYTDSTTFMVQVERKNSVKDLKVQMNKPVDIARSRFIKVPFSPIDMPSKDMAGLLKNTASMLNFNKQMRQGEAKMLDAVEIKSKKAEVKDTRKGLYSNASNTFKVDKNLCANYTSVFQMLLGKIPGVNILNKGTDWLVQIRGAANFKGVIEPLYMVDGFPVSKDNINSILPCELESVDVLKGAAASMYGSQSAGGVINVLTKRGNPSYDYTRDTTSGVLSFKRKGYALVKQFYSPDYSKKEVSHEWEDFRSTLYWNPSIQTDAQGKASLSFYNSDEKATFRTIVEGIGMGGLLGSVSHEYIVK
jgi:hypothetical protein